MCLFEVGVLLRLGSP